MSFEAHITAWTSAQRQIQYILQRFTLGLTENDVANRRYSQPFMANLPQHEQLVQQNPALRYLLDKIVLYSGDDNKVVVMEDIANLPLVEKLRKVALCPYLRQPHPAHLNARLPQYAEAQHHPNMINRKTMYMLRISTGKQAKLYNFSERKPSAIGLGEFRETLRRANEHYFEGGFKSNVLADAVFGQPIPMVFRDEWWEYMKWVTGLDDAQLGSWSYKRALRPVPNPTPFNTNQDGFKVFPEDFRLDTQAQYDDMIEFLEEMGQAAEIIFIRTWELETARRFAEASPCRPRMWPPYDQSAAPFEKMLIKMMIYRGRSPFVSDLTPNEWRLY